MLVDNINDQNVYGLIGHAVKTKDCCMKTESFTEILFYIILIHLLERNAIKYSACHIQICDMKCYGPAPKYFTLSFFFPCVIFLFVIFSLSKGRGAGTRPAIITPLNFWMSWSPTVKIA